MRVIIMDRGEMPDEAQPLFDELMALHTEIVEKVTGIEFDKQEGKWTDAWAEGEGLDYLAEVSIEFATIALSNEFAPELVLAASISSNPLKVVSAMAALWAAGFTDGWELHKKRLADADTTTAADEPAEA